VGHAQGVRQRLEFGGVAPQKGGRQGADIQRQGSESDQARDQEVSPRKRRGKVLWAVHKVDFEAGSSINGN
jgi:hypothetical protein